MAHGRHSTNVLSYVPMSSFTPKIAHLSRGCHIPFRWQLYYQIILRQEPTTRNKNPLGVRERASAGMKRGLFMETMDSYQTLNLPNSDSKLIVSFFKEVKTVIHRDPFLVVSLFLKDPTIMDSTLAINRSILKWSLSRKRCFSTSSHLPAKVTFHPSRPKLNPHFLDLLG